MQTREERRRALEIERRKAEARADDARVAWWWVLYAAAILLLWFTS